MTHGVALVAVRVLAIYLGAQFLTSLANSAHVLLRLGDRDWSGWLPHAAGLAVAVVTWLAAPAIARAAARGAGDGARQGRFVLNEGAIASLIQIALLIAGIVLSADAVGGIAFAASQVSSPFGIIETEPSWYSRNGPILIANGVKLAIGLFLVFRGRSVGAFLARIREWWVPTPEDDEDDDPSKPSIEWR